MPNWIIPVGFLVVIGVIIYAFVAVRDRKHYADRNAKNGKSR